MGSIYNLDPANDANRLNPEVHYRLYLASGDHLMVVCVQDFDYPDYDRNRFVTYQAWTTENEALDALDTLVEQAHHIVRATTKEDK